MTGTTRAVAAGLGLAATAAVGAFAWGVIVERNRFTVRHELLPILAPGARPLTILHLSDLHMAPWQRSKQNFVRSLIRYEPDLVVNTGDNFGHRDGLSGIERALAPFAGIPGVFVHGSNDYYGPELKNPFSYFGGSSRRRTKKEPELDTDSLNGFFVDALGWHDLANKAGAIELRGTRLELFGTGDAHRHWDRLDALPRAIDELRESAAPEAADANQLSVGVTHAPYRRVLDAFTNQGAALILAGHTHGGQVRIPGLPALVTNADLPRRQASGLSQWRTATHSAALNVSAGIGTSIYAPVRFACPPEAVVLTLTAP
ncbi:MAG TPA: metallophosphoesterase [Pseudolysinimonas sp.]|nr:metallophosphoesterase [Pseudolysinimonas sp.]